MKANSKGLGKGLDALIPKDNLVGLLSDAGNSGIQHVRVTLITANPQQPRLKFDDGAIEELASSINEHGILQPLVVTKTTDGFQLIAGERRLRAAKRLGLETVPVLVREADMLQKLELALIENLQRRDLNPLELAESIIRLHEDFSIAYDQIAKRLGKAYTTVINTTRLKRLPEVMQKALAEKRISEGHARCLLALENKSKLQSKLFGMIISKNLSVRQTEEMVISYKKSVNTDSAKKGTSLASSTEESRRLSKQLGLVVKVKTTKAGKGSFSITFSSQKEYEKIINLLSR